MKFINDKMGFIVIGVAVIAILAFIGNRKNAKILSDNKLKAKETKKEKED